jgi:UDP-glucose 4-epimerase
VQGTATVLRCAAEAGVRRLVHVSSAEVYGTGHAGPVPESAPTLPRSPYGAAKLGAEALVRSWSAQNGLERVVLRPFSVYGPGSPATSLVGTVVRAAAHADVVELRSLDTVRDYVHVTDVAAAVQKALDHPDGSSPVFNVGTGAGTPVRELVRLALLGAGREIPVRVTGDRDRPDAADLSVLVADPRRARDELGWVSGTGLEDGLAAAVDAQG